MALFFKTNFTMVHYSLSDHYFPLATLPMSKCLNSNYYFVPCTKLKFLSDGQLLRSDRSAGQCWTEINSSGKCGSMVSSSMIREECCSTGSTNGAMMSAFIDRDLSSGEIFKMKMFKGGIPCEPCKGIFERACWCIYKYYIFVQQPVQVSSVTMVKCAEKVIPTLGPMYQHVSVMQVVPRKSVN